jgi:hypothetical protein
VPPPGFFKDIKKRVTTGKLLRPDVADDILRLPVDEAKFRFPSPGYVHLIYACFHPRAFVTL